MNEVLVLGIDPAPAKNTVIFNGTAFYEFKAEKLAEKLIEMTSSKNVLLCWDAPLTGPHSCKKNVTNPFSQRPIEAFFTRTHKGYDFKIPKIPKGISVMGYSGCPHWAITKAVLGLPKIGQYEQVIETPYQLITSGEYISNQCVVEVHPAVAIWLWCKEDSGINWNYKTNQNNLTRSRLQI